MGGSVVGEGVKMWGSETPPYLPGADRHKRESRRSAQGADLTPHPPFLLGLRGVRMLVRFEGGGSHLDVGETCSVLLRFFPPSPYTYNVRPALVWVWRSGGRCGVVGLVWGGGASHCRRVSPVQNVGFSVCQGLWWVGAWRQALGFPGIVLRCWVSVCLQGVAGVVRWAVEAVGVFEKGWRSGVCRGRGRGQSRRTSSPTYAPAAAAA